MDEFTKVPVLYWKYDFTRFYALLHVSKRWRVEQICLNYVTRFSFIFVELDGVALNNLPLLLHLYFDIIVYEKLAEEPEVNNRHTFNRKPRKNRRVRQDTARDLRRCWKGIAHLH